MNTVTHIGRCLAAVSLFASCGCAPTDRAAQGSAQGTSPSGGPMAFVRDGSMLRVHNAAHGVEARFDTGHAIVALDGDGVTWSMELTRFGRSGAMLDAARAPAAIDPAHPDTVTYARAAGVREWYANTASGIEQGFAIDDRAAGEGALRLELASVGMAATLEGDRVALHDASGAVRAWYGGLFVRDGRGRDVPARLVVQDARVAIVIDDRAAEYPLAVDPFVTAKYAKITTTDAVAGDGLGAAVAIDGNTAVLGARETNGRTGAAYVFTRPTPADNWTQQKKFVGTGSGWDFGVSVAVSGDTVVVGQIKISNPGAAHVFLRTGVAWSAATVLTASDGTDDNRFGSAVAIDGNTLVVGAAEQVPNGTPAWGASAYVFTRPSSTSTVWTERAKLAGAANGGFGSTVAIQGDTIVVGAPLESEYRGAAYVYTRPSSTSNTWTLAKQLVPSTLIITGGFGRAVALNGNTALVGSTYDSAFVFTRPSATSTDWTEQAKLTVSGTTSLGKSVAMIGDTVFLGSNTPASGPCRIYPFARFGTTWSAQAAFGLDTGCGSSFGESLSASGQTVLVGEPAMISGHGFVVGGGPGDPCTATTLCATGVCVEGVCCDNACTDTCKSCLASRTGGANGVCSPISNGGADARCPATSCALPAGTGPSVCNGAGACRPSAATSCGLYGCSADAQSCRTACAADADCAPSAWCSGTTCVAKKTPGTTCARVGECASGNCVEGVCCDTACTGTCQSCVLSATGKPDGTCSPVLDAKDPRGDCPGTTCATDTLTQNVCNGSGACRPQSTSCAPFACRADGTACAKTCTLDADCGTTGYCDADKICAGKKKRAAACTADKECASGACADGVCCDRACAGQCEACAEPAAEGTCIAVKGKPRATHAACSGEGTACGGQCDGINAAVCAYPSVGTSCGAGCTDGKLSVCDATGSCVAPAACPGNLACDGTTKCKTACVVAADCAGGYVCVGGACKPPKSTCDADGMTSIGPDGQRTSCDPYRCGSDGSCPKNCATSADCAAGRSCDTSSGNGLCVAAPPPATEDGGGCSVGARSAQTPPLALAALAMFALRRRARRRIGCSSTLAGPQS